MLGVTVSMPVSGGHINPAVSVAFAATGKFSWAKIPHYVLGQYLGSLIAQILLFIIYFDGISALDGGVRSAYGTPTSTGQIFATFPPDHVGVLTALFDQIYGTALLLIAVCAIGDQRGMRLPKNIQPIVIALLVTAIATGMSHNCGAVLNPARDLAPRIFLSMVGYGWQPFEPIKGHYWYIAGLLGPHLGAIIGCWVYDLLIGNYLDEVDEKQLETDI
jgi:aquaglyceroporin related protein